MITILRWGLIVIAILLGLWFVVALGLIFSPAPKFSQRAPEETAPWSPRPDGVECQKNNETRCFKMRDGAELSAQWFDAKSKVTVVLLHGVKSYSGELETTALQIQQSSNVNVFTLDLRGHGASDGNPGDIDYIGQYENDIADMIATLRKDEPDSRLILAGHSMGGGIVMRYAARPDMPTINGYLLLAPHLGTNSPTTPTEIAEGTESTGGTASEPMVKIHLRRTIGLIMFNVLRIMPFNGLATLYFNVPDNFPIKHYSYRAMVSTAPDDHITALTNDSLPLLVLVGENDEAFRAEKYPEVIRLHNNGEVVILARETHDSVLHSPAAIEAIHKWLASWATVTDTLSK